MTETDLSTSKSIAELNFYYNSQVVRRFIDENKTSWFCATDVCGNLGYDNVSQVIKDNILGKRRKHRPEGATKEMVYISESDLYNLVLRSSKPEAVPFRKWVCEEVLPSIRKTGKYIRRLTAPAGAEQSAESEPPSAEFEPPVTFKPTLGYALPRPLVSQMISARRLLREQGKEFETDKEFLGYLVSEGLNALGISQDSGSSTEEKPPESAVDMNETEKLLELICLDLENLPLKERIGVEPQYLAMVLSGELEDNNVLRALKNLKSQSTVSRLKKLIEARSNGIQTEEL